MLNNKGNGGFLIEIALLCLQVCLWFSSIV